jgi:hypothetical protein
MNSRLDYLAQADLYAIETGMLKAGGMENVLCYQTNRFVQRV